MTLGPTRQQWATAAVSLVDGESFDSAAGGRALLVLTGDQENTGMVWKDASRTSVGNRWGSAPVLMVDEAHTLSPETLEEIRLLTNFETAEEKLLQIILAGQSDLATMLNRQDLRQLKQRIEVRMDLKPLAPADVGAYMRYRWSHAGGSAPLPFSPEAIALIAKASRGIPRVVNCICDNALLLAYAGEEAVIASGHVLHVLRDLDLDETESARSNGKRLVRRDLGQAIFGESEAPKFAEGGEGGKQPSQMPSPARSWTDEINLGPIRSRQPKP